MRGLTERWRRPATGSMGRRPPQNPGYRPACRRGGPPRRRQTGHASLRHRPHGPYHVRPGCYGVDATSTSCQRHGWDIHAVCRRGSPAAGAHHQSRQPDRSPAAPESRRRSRAGPAAAGPPRDATRAGPGQRPAGSSRDGAHRGARGRPVLRGRMRSADRPGPAARDRPPRLRMNLVTTVALPRACQNKRSKAASHQLPTANRGPGAALAF